jgi:hypothetical protein
VRTIRVPVRLLLLATTMLIGAEAGARLDDWMFQGVPPLSSPTYDSELRLQDHGFVRGRPNGHFKRWQLNEHGFNGPPNALVPPKDCVRVVVLGASETFGSFESPGREFVSQLRRRLEGEGCFEVINASIVGMSMGSAKGYFEGWVRRFDPHVVLIYPNPLLNLRIAEDSDAHCASRPPERAPPPPAPEPPPVRSRFLDRLRDAFDTPQWLVDAGIERQIARKLEAHGPDWPMTSVPQECLRAFEEDVQTLVRAVHASGAVAVVSTHANVLHDDAVTRQGLWLRQWVPRVTAEGQIRFHDRANDRLRSLSADSDAAVFDAERALGGCAPCFVDPVHFSDEGADRLAAAMAPFLAQLAGPGKHALQ